MKRIELYFYGYTWEEYAFQISGLNGIFVIYQGCLNSEGTINIRDILYIGYHNGIIGLYENGVIDSIKQFVEPGCRLFLSYAETPNQEDGKNLASMIINIANPKFKQEIKRSNFQNAKIIIKGNCKFIPEEIII